MFGTADTSRDTSPLRVDDRTGASAGRPGQPAALLGARARRRTRWRASCRSRRWSAPARRDHPRRRLPARLAARRRALRMRRRVHLIAERHEALCSLLRNLAGGQWAVWTHRLHRVVERRAVRTRPSPASRATCRGPTRPSSLRGQPHDEQRAVPDAGLSAQRARGSAGRCNRTGARREAIAAVAGRGAAGAGGEDRAGRSACCAASDPRLLGIETRQRPASYSEVAEFLGYLVNGVLAAGAGACRAAVPHAADGPAVLRRRQAGAAPRRRAALRGVGGHPRVRRRGASPGS